MVEAVWICGNPYFYCRDWIPNVPAKEQHLWRVKATGQIHRPPKQGEWYISGAIPEAYRAPNDLTQSFTIGTLVRVRKVERWEEDYDYEEGGI